MRALHIERHRTDRSGWLRAAVLGAHDGIVSTASLVVGVAAANATGSDILVAGVAGLVAGAMSMAAGNTFRLAPRQIRKGLTSTANERSLQTIENSNTASWRQSTSVEVWSPRLQDRSRSS